MKKYKFKCWNARYGSPETATTWHFKAKTQTEAEEKAERARAKLDRGKNQLIMEFVCEEEE